MLRYLAQRLLWMLAELLGISLTTFVLAFLVPVALLVPLLGLGAW